MKSHVSEKNPFGFYEKEIELSKIKEHPKNPRSIDSRSKMQLENSLKKFGLIDKPILNIRQDGEFEYLCLAGHQRIAIEKESGATTILAMIPEIPLSVADEEELLIRHNKNTGKFDLEKLLLFDKSDLIDFGFLENELKIGVVDPLDAPVLDPIYPITPKFSEKHGYILIMYDNAIDQSNLETMLGIERVQDYKTQRISLGRVISFSKFLKKWNERGS
jgi:hypothetical protein